MIRTHLFAAALLAVVTPPAWAQPVVHLTLTDAVSRAFEASHRLAEVQARQDGARATVQLRRASSRPSAVASAGYTRTNEVEEIGFPTPTGGIRVVFPNIPDNVVTRVAAQWPIYTAGRADALERAAAAEVGALGADLDTARADLRFEVQRAYWAAVTAQEAVRVLEASVERAEAQVTDARERLTVGLVPPSDVLTFEAQRSRERLQLIETINQRDSAHIDLRRLTGLPPDAEVVLADRLDAPAAFSEQAEAGALVTEALRQRPEQRALEQRILGAWARHQAAAAGRKPTVALAAGSDFANPNAKIFPRQGIWQTSWEAGVTVTWNIFDSGRTKAEAAEAQAAARAAEERLKDLETMVDADVRQRVLDLRSSLASVQAADDGVRAAAEARRVLGERFAVGVATTTDVLVAQDQLLHAELSRARALANVRLAEARLQRALARP